LSRRISRRIHYDHQPQCDQETETVKYIFHCEPDDFILAGRAIKSAINHEHWNGKVCGIGFEDGSLFLVTQNKGSVTVRKSDQHTPMEPNDG
jgi:hypothetical protein